MMPIIPIDGRCPFHGEPYDDKSGTCRVCRMQGKQYSATPGEDIEITVSVPHIAKVVSLADKRAEHTPHLSGEARCMLCQHEWVAVAPIGTPWLECPACHSNKGHMKYPVQRSGLEWQCNCGNDLFRVTPDGYYCPNCGAWQEPR